MTLSNTSSTNFRIPSSTNAYDELPYKSCSVDWSAPERLVLASLLHGGRQPPLTGYRVLELGCGDGANLLPLAYYRRRAAFVGIDGAQSQIEVAKTRAAALELANVELIHADFREAANDISGQFDFVIAHGIFSWVPDAVRDALLELCVKFMQPGGLLYLNYNARPGWNVRGLVREFLLAQTAEEKNLRLRAQLAQEVAGKVAAAMTDLEQPYSQLLANEFRFVNEGNITWVAHEFLSPDNHAYWRSEFLELVGRYGFEYVADADFNYSSGRIPEELAPRLEREKITGRSIDDTIDLLCYRQLHSPILTLGPFVRQMPSLEEFGNLYVASCLERCPSNGNADIVMFRHPSGYEVEAKERYMQDGFEKLYPQWPRGLKVAATFPVTSDVVEDLKLLQKNGLIELRCIEPGDFGVDGGPLNKLEIEWGGYYTTPYHTTVAVGSD